MTPVTSPGDRPGILFIADLHPGLGAYLARQHARGYDAVAGRARFLVWLGTHADGGALRYDLAKAARGSRLTGEEETELATRITAGRRAEDELAQDRALSAEARADLERAARDGALAVDRLTEGNLSLVVSLAKRFAGRGVPLPELVEAGNLGLAKAIQKYDFTKGYRFTTFAAWWIRQAMARAVARGLPRISVQALEARNATDELTLTEQRMLRTLGREPTPEELAAELDLPASAPSRSPRGPGG